jgi:hypothetical protein
MQAGEALGAIGAEQVLPLLEQFSQDPMPEVAETCRLAIDTIKWKQKNPGVRYAIMLLSLCVYVLYSNLHYFLYCVVIDMLE